MKHFSPLLLTAMLLGAGRAAIERYLLPARPTAANSLHAAAAVDSWDRQTDGHPYRYTDPAAHCKAVSTMLVQADLSHYLCLPLFQQCCWCIPTYRYGSLVLCTSCWFRL